MSRFGFVGVPNALNLELSLRRPFEVALVVASWRVVLYCCRRNAPSLQRLACYARWRVVFCSSRGGPPHSFSFSLSLSLSLSISLLFAHFTALRGIHQAPHHVAALKIHRRAALRAC
jgi:hypothetical protein